MTNLLSIHYVTKRYGVRLLTTQKPINRPGWWKGKLALFQMQASEEEDGHLSKGRLSCLHLPHPVTSRGWEILHTGGGLHAETAQSSLTVIFKLITCDLTSVILIVVGTVNYQFQGPFPVFGGQFVELQQLMSCVQSGHYVVKFLPSGFQFL